MSSGNTQVTADGGKLTDRRVKRGLQVSVVAGMLGMTWWAITQGMPLTMFMEALEANGVIIGLATAIPLFSIAIQIPATLWTEKLRSRKACWGIAMLVSRLMWFLPPLFLAFLSGRPDIVAWAMVALLIVSSLLGRSVDPLWFSWMADLVPERVRGRFWGRRQSLTMTAFLLAVALTGHILDTFPPPNKGGTSWTGFILVFVIGAALGTIDIIIHLWVPEPKPQPKSDSANLLERMIEPMRNRDFRNLTFAMGFFTFAVGLITLGIVYLKRDFGATYSHLAAIQIVACVGTIASGFAWGYVMDRIGGRAFSVIMTITAPFIFSCWLFVKNYSTNIVGLFEGVWAIGPGIDAMVTLLPAGLEAWIVGIVLPQPIWLVLFANFFAGALFGGMGLCQLSLVAGVVPKKGRTLAMAVHWATTGLIGAFGSIIAGRVMDHFSDNPLHMSLPNGTPMSFHHVLILGHLGIMWLVVLPLLLNLSRSEDEPDLGTAVSRLLITNPLRAVTNIYIMGSAVASRHRARAVRSLGSKRTKIAVSDLIEKLDDPSADVREEAAWALGSIGSQEAIDALITKLEDPHFDLAPQIARSLRQTRSPRTVEALIKKLMDPDRETRSETARTLGEIGDRRAVPKLLDTLVETTDAKVISSSSEALSRLGEVAAIYAILPRMKETRNPVLKRSLAVAVGDLLGEREEFYKILTREEQTRGTEVDRLLKSLRGTIRKLTRREMHDEGTTLISRLDAVQTLYDDGAFGECSQHLFGLSVALAALRWGIEFGDDSRAFIEDIIWRDQKFGVTVWYLDLLRKGWEEADPGNRDYIDILLGVYSLACRGTQ